jgi:hypothetical protein
MEDAMGYQKTKKEKSSYSTAPSVGTSLYIATNCQQLAKRNAQP